MGKLGLVVDDKHWLNVINRCTMRNVDFARRRRKRKTRMGSDLIESMPCENRTLTRICLEEVPSSPCTEFLSDENSGAVVFKHYLVANKMVPSPTQLQSFCRSIGQP